MWRFVLSLLLLTLVSGCAPKNRRKLIVLLSVDTLNQSALRAFDPNAPELPNLDQFSRQSVRYANAYSSASWTLPAHASLLTGLYPDRHGLTTGPWASSNGKGEHLQLSQTIWTLANSLRQGGYQTVAFTDEVFVSSRFGLDTGFDRYDKKANSTFGRSLKVPRDGRRSRVAGAALFDRAIALLSERQSDSPPLFLFLHTYAVHDYSVKRSWDTRDLGHEGKEDYYYQCLIGAQTCTDEDWKWLSSLYTAELVHLDKGFGRLLDAIETTGQRDKSIIILVSDHGEGFDPELQRISHGGRLHEDLVRIPVLVQAPGGKAGVRHAPISLVDIAPTILELVGLTAPGDVDGRAFTESLYRDGDVQPRTLFAMEHAYWWKDGTRQRSEKIRKKPVSLAVIEGDTWYIRGVTGEQLYDMKTDPAQLNNQAALITHIQQLEDLRATAGRRGTVTKDQRLLPEDQHLMEQLRSLGYLHGGRSSPKPDSR